MTNYEKYKDEFIELLAISNDACKKVFKMRTKIEKCPLSSAYVDYDCKDCEALNKQWLNEVAKEFDPAELKAGDRIIMRKHGDLEFYDFKVVCNSFPSLWLRFRATENGLLQASDENFLIPYDVLLDEYEVREVIRND